MFRRDIELTATTDVPSSSPSSWKLPVATSSSARSFSGVVCSAFASIVDGRHDAAVLDHIAIMQRLDLDHMRGERLAAG